MYRYLALSILTVSISAFAEQKPVKVVFVEALSKTDTTSSERFRQEYETAIQQGLELSRGQIAKCGYEIKPETKFFESSDDVQAYEIAQKESKSGSWLIVGPRRSNHYLLLAKGAGDTPTLSTMASAKEVFELPSHNLTFSPSNAELAKGAVDAAIAKQAKAKTYISVVKSGCVSCEDFSRGFKSHAENNNFVEQKFFNVIGDEPSVDEITTFIKQHKPSFILLPNYSKLSAYLMSKLYKENPNVIFIGGDGWGDKNFGFVQNNPAEKPSVGITVRGAPPVENALAQFDLGKRLQKKIASSERPQSGSGLALIKTFDGLTKILCSKKPQNKSEFKNAFTSIGKKEFMAPWGVSIYELNRGAITYNRSLYAR